MQISSFSGRLQVVFCFSILLAAFHRIFGIFFPLVDYRMGHDYSLALPALLDGLVWYKNNGLTPPWFTPSFCAGQPFFADPQSTYYSLLQAMAILTSPLVASYLVLLISVSLAYWGGYLLMRRVFLTDRPSAVLVAGMLMFNGFLPHRMVVGHLGFHGLALLPWLALLLLLPVRRQVDSLAAAVGAGLILAAWVHGGMGSLMLPAAMGVLVIALLCAMRQNGAMERFFFRGGAAALLGLLLSASKLAAAGALMANFPRNQYPLPGAKSLIDSLVMVLTSLFLPSEIGYRIITPRLANIMWTLTPHEWAYGFTLAGGLLMLVLLVRTGRRVAFPMSSRNLAWLSLLLFCLVWPVLFCTYSPKWNAFLKTLPILGSASTPTRWMILYIPFVAVGCGLLLCHSGWSTRIRTLVVTLTLAGTVLITAFEPRGYYLEQDYDIRPMLVADNLVREGRLQPHIHSLGTSAQFAGGEFRSELRRNDTFVAGVSQVFCYNPIFGYRLETFSANDLVAGDVLQTHNGHLNLKNPACYVFPEENGCRPGDRFRADQVEQARRFVSYRPFEFAVSRRQEWANRISIASLWLVGLFLLGWVAARAAGQVRRRGPGQ